MIEKQEPQVLTKFMNFRPEIFMQPRLKLALPSEFNDLFDSQLRLSEEDFARLAVETGRDIGQLKYFAQRMSAVHILSLSALAANELKSSHMWGLYANSGKDIAFEFDFVELENLVNGEPLSSFMNGYNQFQSDEDKQKISYIKSNLNESILKQLRKYHRFLVKEVYKIDNTDGIVTIPADHINYPELAAFEVDFNSKNLCEMVSDSCHLLMHVLDLRYYKSMLNLNHRLYKVEYVDNYSLLKSHFIEICSAKLDQIDRSLIGKFMSHKTNNWKSEEEYRLLIADYTMPIIKSIEQKIYNKEIKSWDVVLKDLNQQVNDKMEFVYFDDELQVKKLENALQNNSSNNRDILYPITILPFPKKIYLGWDFDTDSKYGKENLALIKRYCNKHGIKHLYKLEKTVDYDDSRFRCGLNLVDA
jgi:hypothetical protein